MGTILGNYSVWYLCGKREDGEAVQLVVWQGSNVFIGC